MTSNRLKATARELQAREQIPYAEALRRARTTTLASMPSAVTAATAQHECMRGKLWLTDARGHHTVCHRCATAEHRDRIDAVDAAAREMKLLPRVSGMGGSWHGLEWPYGPNIDVDTREALVAWAGPHGLRLSGTHSRCLHWLQGKRCPRSWGESCAAGVPGADHVTAWNRGAGRNPAVLVSQPYGLDEQARRQLADIDSQPGLRVEIDEAGGWYGAGTTFVAIWRTEGSATR
jgi:hypothetical protein